MAAEQDIIREFLVSLGFKIDKSGLEAFVKGMAAASSAVLASVTVIEDNLERLFFASQRTKASAENIRAFGFSLSQMGSSAGAALDAIENLARFLRNSPGGAGLIESLGVQTRNANGQLRDTSQILQDLGKQFAAMPYYRANAYAQLLGIDEKTLMALREGLGDFGDQYRDMLAKAGLNLDEATKKSHEFMVETRSLGSAFVILGQKISSSLSSRLIGVVTNFRDAIVDNFGRITEVVDALVRGVTWIAEAIGTMALRALQAAGELVDWFNSLDDQSKKTIELIAGIGVAWVALNKLFKASPIGLIAAVGTAILSLYDDYKTWREGGQHLIPWEAWEPQINQAIFGVTKLGVILKGLASMVSDLFHGRFSKVREDFEATARRIDQMDAEQAKRNASDPTTGDGLSQKYVDSLKSGGGAKLSADSAKRLAPDGSNNGIDFGNGSGGWDLTLPRGIRNNNPGNIEFARQPGATLETNTPDRKRFAQFRTPEEGLAALAIQLRKYGSRGIDTLNSIIGTYAPKWENNTAAYVARLSREMGVSPDAHLNLSDSGMMQQLMTGIIRFENANQNPYSADQLRVASMAGAGGVPAASAAPIVNQTNNINVSGTGASDTAQAVSSEMDNVNIRLLRNLAGAAR